MNATRYVSLRNKTLQRLRDKHYAALVYKPRSSVYHDDMRAIIGAMPRNTPHNMKQYLQGYIDCLANSLYDDGRHGYLVYGGIYKGKFYSCHSNRPDYYANNGIEPSEWARLVHTGEIVSGHYWAEIASDGTMRPWFTSKGV